MGNPVNMMTLLIVVSMILLVFGFTWRNRYWGPVIMLVGALSMLGSIIYRIVLALS